MSAVLLTVASGIAWGGIIMAFWEPVPERAMDGLTAIAPTLTVVAVMCWITGGNRRRDEGRGLLVRALAEVIRPASRLTGPLRRVK